MRLAHCSAWLPLCAVALPAFCAPKQLAIVRPALHQYEDGPDLERSFSFLAGDTVFLSFQIQGYQASPDSKIELHVRIDVADPKSVPVVKTIDHAISEQLSVQDKNWMPIVRDSIQLPPIVLQGTYHIRVAAQDAISKQEAKSEIAFDVQGKRVEPSETLVARDFRFLPGEEDRNPMVQAVYRPGDSVWARFEITGFRYGANNLVNVSYGVSLTGPDGKTLFSQPQAAAEEGEAFYPKPYVPGALGFNLDKKIKPGEYTVVLTLRDEIGTQSDESRHTFSIQ
jgi:hypothetical protein